MELSRGLELFSGKQHGVYGLLVRINQAHRTCLLLW